jgi:inositol oxygenase
MTDHDVEMFDWVRRFNPYDLYSKGSERPKLQDVKPYYDELFAEFFPAQIDW